MTTIERAYRYWLALACVLLCWLAPAYVWASLSHRATLPFPDRAQHAAQQNPTAHLGDHHLASNPKHTRRVGARDVGKAAAARRWVGASPYDWDGRDKLRSIRKPDGTRLDYSYDAFGRRVSKTRSGGPFDDKRVEFLWDGEVLAWELDTETGPRAFVHEPGGFEPVLQQQGGETYLCVNDHLGMPKELIDGSGRLAWAASHSAYGKVIATEGPPELEVEGGFVSGGEPRVESPFRLLGQVNDDDAELAWTRFRCFDADTGTWISTDPLGLVGGTQTYGFDGSPTRAIDPMGLSTSGGSPHEGIVSSEEAAALLINAGVPPEHVPGVIQAFDGPITARTARKGERFLATETATGSASFRWIAKEMPATPAERRRVYALPNTNTAEVVNEVVLTEDTVVLEGTAREQTRASWAGPYATGGGRQTFVPRARKSVGYV